MYTYTVAGLSAGNKYECIKQHFPLNLPPFNILLGETLYFGLNSWTRSAPAMLTWAWDLGVVYCVYCSYGDMAIGVTDNSQVMAALSWPLNVYVFIISKLTGADATQAQSSANT